MSIVARQRCDCGYYLRTDELEECRGDSGACVFECPACGQGWQVEWRVCWERATGPESAGDNGEGD